MENLIEKLEHFSKTQPDQLLLRASERNYSYKEFFDQALQLHATLEQGKLQKGDRVALLSSEYDSFFIKLVGAWLYGLSVITLNATLPAEDIETLIECSGAGWLLEPHQRF